jgi:hypothetical protein
LEMSLSFCSFTNLGRLGLSVLSSWPLWRLGDVEASWWLQKRLPAAEFMTSTCGIACPSSWHVHYWKIQVLKNLPAKAWLGWWFHILEIAMQV